MKKITLEYRRFFRQRTQQTNLPENWRELDAHQFVYAVKLWLGEVGIAEFLHHFLGIKKKVISLLSDYQMWVLMHEIDWIQNLHEPHNAFFIETLPGTPLESPGDRLKGCSLQQFMTADTFFSLYCVNQERDNLHAFIASLYKRENEVFSVEEPVEPQMQNSKRLVVLDEHIEQVERLPEIMKQAVFLNFILIRSWLSRAFPLVFPEPEEEEPGIRRNKRQRKPKPVDWVSIFDALVGDNLADMEKYKAIPATDAFRIMNRRIREARMRAAEKAQRNVRRH